MKVGIVYGVICLLAVLLTAYFIHPFWLTLYTCGVLVLFELALGFDNAVVNAKILNTMSPFWQKMFLTWGIIIAVFVVRFCLPILLVYGASHYSLAQVLQVVFHQPKEYSELLYQTFPIISGFGAGFLGMLFLNFLAESQQEQKYWWSWFESMKLWRSVWGRLLVFVLVGLVFAYFEGLIDLLWAYLVGGILQWGLFWFREKASHRAISRTGSIVQAGFIAFIYLELIDASFSLDSVLGAFAITDHIVIIMVGLGCGALVIRALTVQMVRGGTLQKWRYLEHGAHYAIGVLALILLLCVVC